MKNHLKLNHTVLLTVVICLLGCKSRDAKIAETLDGGYVLNKIEYKGTDITPEVIAAILSFNDFKFKPPIISSKVGKIDKYDWKPIEEKNEIRIKFNTENQIFKDIFKISFKIDDSSEQIHLYMKSKSTHISATRVFLLDDFDVVKRKLILLN